MKRLVYLLLFFSIQHTVTAADECKDLLKKVLQEMKRTVPDQGKGISMNYSVTVKVTDNVYTENIQVDLFDKKLKMTSGEITMYQDAKTMVVIHPEENTIFMTRPTSETFRKIQLQNFLVKQDSLFKFMILKSCSEEQSQAENKALKKMVLQFPPNMKGGEGINSITYWIDEAHLLIHKVHVAYSAAEEQEMEALTFEFKKIDYQYTGLTFEGSASEKVVDARNNLLPKYKNYTLIDKR